MALLKEDKIPTYKNVKVRMNEETLAKIEKYKDYAEFSSIDKVIEKMCEHVIEADKEFKKHIDEK